MTGKDYNDHNITLPVRGTKSSLKKQLAILVETMGLSIVNKAIQEGVPRHRAYTLYAMQLEKMVEELEKGEEFRAYGIPRVLYKLNRRLKVRWPDFDYQEAEELSAKVGTKIEAFILFLYKSYTLGYIPTDKKLPHFVTLFTDLRNNSIVDEMTHEEYVVYKAVNKAVTDFYRADSDNPEEKYRYLQLLEIIKKILTENEYEWFSARFLDLCEHSILAEIFGSTEGACKTRIHRIAVKLRKHPWMQEYLD